MQQWPPKVLERIFSFLSDEDKVKSRLVSKRFDASLRPLITKLDIGVNIDQAQLKALARSYPNLRELDLTPEHNERCGMLDFKAVHLPELRTLYLRSCRMKTLHFTRANTPLMESLTVNNAIGAFDGIKFDLPELKEIRIEYATVQPLSFVAFRSVWVLGARCLVQHCLACGHTALKTELFPHILRMQPLTAGEEGKRLGDIPVSLS